MIVLVCGGRKFHDKKFLYSVLDHINKHSPILTIIHGDAKGADSLGGRWARENDVLEHAKPADWGKYGKSAGFKRNVEMINMNPHLVVAFTGGVGTAMMIRISKEHGVKVMDFQNHEGLIDAID